MKRIFIDIFLQVSNLFNFIVAQFVVFTSFESFIYGISWNCGIFAFCCSAAASNALENVHLNRFSSGLFDFELMGLGGMCLHIEHRYINCIRYFLAFESELHHFEMLKNHLPYSQHKSSIFLQPVGAMLQMYTPNSSGWDLQIRVRKKNSLYKLDISMVHTYL